MPNQPSYPSVSASQAPSPAGDGEVVIRTMQDDVASLGTAPRKSSSSIPPATAAPSFPLPPVNAASPQKIVMSPQAPRKKKRVWVPVLAGFVVVAVLIGGGWYAFRNYASLPATESNPVTVKTAAQILPKDASLIIGYSLKNPQDRASIMAAWQGNGSQKTALTDLLSGNPLALLNDQMLQEMYVVTFSGDTRPYIIVPETPTLTTLLANNSQTPAVRQDGWVIIHQIRTDTYTQALASGSLEATNNAFLFSSDQPGSVRFLISSNLAEQIIKESSLAMPPFGLGSIRLVGQFTDSNLIMSGNIDNFKPLSLTLAPAQQRLLTTVPSDVLTMQIGGDFAGSVQQAQQARIIDSAISSQPAVAQLINTFNESYAYYMRLGPDQLKDWGLVVQIPPSLQSSLKLGDSVLEQSLQALVPVITDRPLTSQLAFADAVYQDIPLRYVNIGNSSQALDYTIDGEYIVAATSKEGIFTLLDTLRGRLLPFEASREWQPLLSAWGSLPAASNFLFLNLKNPSLVQLLPHKGEATVLPLGVGIDFNSSDGKVQAAVLLTP